MAMDLTVFCSFVQYLVAPRRPVAKAVIKNPFVADSTSKESFCGGQQQFFTIWSTPPPCGEFFYLGGFPPSLIWGVEGPGQHLFLYLSIRLFYICLYFI